MLITKLSVIIIHKFTPSNIARTAIIFSIQHCQIFTLPLKQRNLKYKHFFSASYSSSPECRFLHSTFCHFHGIEYSIILFSSFVTLKILIDITCINTYSVFMYNMSPNISIIVYSTFFHDM